MSKERYNQIIDEAYENFRVKVKDTYFPVYRTKEEFIDTVKNYPEFSKKWGLKIEERELSREERYNLMPSITGHSQGNIEERKRINNFEGNIPGVSYHEEWIDSYHIPKRAISLTYNNETITVYE